MDNRNHYNILANLFRYPDDNYKDDVKKCEDMMLSLYPDVYLETLPFFNYVKNEEIDKVEEIFSMTFHIQAICFLDLGYVLFAEDYKRGELLVKIKDEQRRANNDCGNELADNLPNILTLMTKMEDKVFLDEFATRIVKVSLEKMLEEFNLARIELKNKVRLKKQKVLLVVDEQNRNIYQYAIQGLLSILKEDFKHVVYNDPIIIPTLGGDFIKNCSTGCATVETQQIKK
jgi:nitrate reductase assembly molybdenum cofactor insertion protein NarJ